GGYAGESYAPAKRRNRLFPLRVGEEVGCLTAAELIREVRSDEAVCAARVGRLLVDLPAAGLAVEVREDPVLGGLVAVEGVRLQVAVAAVGGRPGWIHREGLVAEVAELPQRME